jgi:hypothetical protein
MRRPDEQQPEPPGGHAGERLREFLDKRKPQDQPVPAPTSDKTSESAPPERNDTGQAPGEHAPEDP